jgi:tetratricopeptide (TPR) repeat protein
MARQDIAGLLTGISSQGPDPMSMGGNAAQQRLAFGAQRAEGMRRGLMGAMGRDPSTPAENLQKAMAQLDLNNAADLTKLAQLQQATGNYTEAAKTAAAARDLKLQENSRKAVSEQLSSLGQDVEAQQVLDKTLSVAAGQSIVTQIKGEQRRGAASAAAKAAQDQQKIEEKRSAASKLLILKGFDQDSEEVSSILSGAFDNLTDSQLTSAVNALALYSNPKITSDALTAYNTPEGVKMVGKWTIETPQGVKQVFGWRDENGVPVPIDPEKSTKVKELEGISSSNTRVKNIMVQLATAGELGARDAKGELIEGFVTDANDAWNSLPPEKQLEVATAIDVRAEYYRKRKRMNQLQAQRTAIKEIFTDNVEEREFTPDFNFNDTVLNLSKFETEIAQEFIDPSSSTQTGTFQGTSKSGIDITFTVEDKPK